MFHSVKSFLVIFVFIVLPSILYSTIINIPADYATIQAGINVSVNADTVLVQPGTYVENIYFDGKQITVASLFLTTQNPTYISSTIIDGNASGSVVIFQDGENLSTLLTGFTITNGLANSGGGIYCEAASPSLEYLIITGNSADYEGGGIYLFQSNPNLKNLTVTDNSVQYDGGSIYADMSNPSMVNTILWNNSPQDVYVGAGSITATYSDIELGWAGTGNIDTDPLFVDPGNGDYSLQSTSLCIDTGDPLSPLDPDSTRVDMGAYYYQQYNGPIWHVSKTGSDTTGDGSVGLPFATIQFGINASADTDTVLVQPGIYVENIDYNGKLITLGSLFLTTQDTSYISSTIIDGNEAGSVVTFQFGEYSSAILTGFTITNGWADNGGGIYCDASCPTINNLIISGNGANLGGGVYCSESDPILESISISGNLGYFDGGGIYCCFNSEPILEDVNISGNVALKKGSGIFCYESNMNMWNVRIIDNTYAEEEGGGIYCYDSNLFLNNLTVSGNSATIGGGICCWGSGLFLQSVTISNNGAAIGGGIWCSSAGPDIKNSILWNNSPENIYVDSGSITVTYSDIDGGYTGIGNIDTEPLFVDAGNGDYSLQSTSPCIDTGDPISPLDPDGTFADMGAYYYDQVLNPIPPLADFVADTTNGDVPLTVNFTDISTQGTGEIDEWYWDFGDGNNSILQNPSNEYSLPGNYTVSLTATDVNDSTGTETKVDYITVDPPAYSGPVWHISTTGSDATGDGSVGLPFATIQYGIDSSADADTVLVQPGTYVENIYFNDKRRTVGSLFLTTQNTSYISSTIIDGNELGSVVSFYEGFHSAILTGFTITNGDNLCGGGIDCNRSNPILNNLIISGNRADCGGGIYCYNECSLIIENVTIVDNIGLLEGGGIYCKLNSYFCLENVTISRNTASIGGGIWCDIAGADIVNSILWNNSPEEISINEGLITAIYSDVKGGWTGTGNIDSDPLFVDPSNGDFHLQSTSQCIDAGDPALPFDPDGTIADIGAYYFHQIFAPQNVLIDNSGTDVNINWDVVPDANSYIVYSSDDPYSGFVIDTSGSFTEESWSTSIGNMKKFYYVIATTEEVK